MAELTPYPLAALARRMFRELESSASVFDLPAGRFFLGHPERNFAVHFHGHRASSPLGPAAGPHTQMAQNIVLAWLGGARIMELKTVQIRDDLEIPRPCIDMRTIGLNAEWSQELKLEQSLEEYVKAAMLIEMLEASDRLEIGEGFSDLVFDLSVGYDLAGIASQPVQAFLHGMMDAGATVERLRRQLPRDLGAARELDFTTRLADTVTLSTFHGCPPEEIESIIEFLMEELRLHCVIKFNPMLLGAAQTRELLHERLGYREIRVPDSAFERDATWPQAVEIVERLQRKAAASGLGLGVKLTNTLIVDNDQGFLPASEDEVYLSGPPLHVLAMHLVQRFRRHFGAALPISFSAGVDRFNYPDMVALGLVPITVCTDLLKKGGYGRLRGYHDELARRMERVGAHNVGEFILRANQLAAQALDTLEPRPEAAQRTAALAALESGGDLEAAVGAELFERWVIAAKELNTRHYVESLVDDPRYHQERHSTPPRKIGSHLELFDCITCDLCVPVCPNDANFTYVLAEESIPIVRLFPDDGGWRWSQQGVLALRQRHQIGNLADFCNDCGNCDVFCPEDGGPYLVKPRFFRRAEDWRRFPELDGFQMQREGRRDSVLGRFAGRDYRLEVEGETLVFSGAAFTVRFQRADPAGTVAGEGRGEVDLTYCFIMDALRRAILDSDRMNYINALAHG